VSEGNHQIRFSDCLFDSNIATVGAGGSIGFNSGGTDAVVETCEFTRNAARTAGELIIIMITSYLGSVHLYMCRVRHDRYKYSYIYTHTHYILLTPYQAVQSPLSRRIY
jgi:hypothetical protein